MAGVPIVFVMGKLGIGEGANLGIVCTENVGKFRHVVILEQIRVVIAGGVLCISPGIITLHERVQQQGVLIRLSIQNNIGVSEDWGTAAL